VTRWTAFAAITAAVLFFVLFLARVSQGHVSGASSTPSDAPALPAAGEDPGADRPDETAPGATDPWNRPVSVETAEESREATAGPARTRRGTPEPERHDPSTASLLANVTVSQGVFLTVLAAAAWLTAVPAGALGIATVGAGEVAVGTALGLALYLTNEVGSGLARRAGIGHDESLRDLLAPDSLAGWVLLLGVVLPVIAGFEELLFRAALVGAIPAGFDVSPWVMVGFSSVAFGVGHGAQGRAGIAVTGALGAVLAGAFVLTGSLVVVVVAHYLVNAVEFLRYETPRRSSVG
jgi:membrane protease YdiL (CAAX protease family)